MVRITTVAIEQLASDFNPLLKYFCGYWEATKFFLFNIFNNEIIANESRKLCHIILYNYIVGNCCY